MILEDGVFWFCQEDDGSGVDDPLSGLDSNYIKSVELAYSQHCASVHSQERSSKDADIMCVVEGKSLGGWRGSSKREKLGREIRTSTRYQNLVRKERNLASQQFRRYVEKFRNLLRTEVQSFIDGRRPLSNLKRRTADLFKEAYLRGWEAGRRASGLLALQKRPRRPSREEEQWFRSAVREELSFWQAFLDELMIGAVGKFTIWERVEMYVKTIWYMFHSGRLSGLPEAVLIHWYPERKVSGRMCPGCAYMVKMSPFPRDVLPTVPRGGDTPCLMRCVHKLVVRNVTQSEVDRRRMELPSKSDMLRVLRRIMGGKIKKYRVRDRSYNPWLGQTTWGELR